MGASEELGPQHSEDGPFRARMRLHQSWYRAAVLGLPHGNGPDAGSGQPLGSMLTREHAASGRNFLDPIIFAVAQRRMSAGPGVDPFRCLANMLASQPMCFNLFGPLVEDTELATRLLRPLLPDVERVVEVHIQYAPSPRSEYLGDRTAFDAFVGYERTDGARAFVGVVIALADGLGTADSVSDRYWDITRSPGSPWREDCHDDLAHGRLAPLWRGHLLVEALRRHPAEPYRQGRFAIVHHPADEDSGGAVAEYRQCLRDAEATFCDWRMDHLLGLWQEAALTARELEWLAAFRLRYLDLEESESAVTAAAATGVPAPASAGER